MLFVSWFGVVFLLSLPCFSVLQGFQAPRIVFNYNNTYKYNVSYEVSVDKNTEYIMEFAGDMVLYETPARVTVASNLANKTFPLFITARQQKGVFSWQLPMLVQTPDSVEQFSNISRTLCPHNNMFAEDDDTCGKTWSIRAEQTKHHEFPQDVFLHRYTKRGTAHEEATHMNDTVIHGHGLFSKVSANAIHEYLDTPTLNTPIVHLTSSSPDPIKVTIKVETVQDFYIKLNSTTNLSSTPSQPKYYFYPFDQNKNNLVDLSTQNIKRKHMCNEELNASEQSILNRYYEMANLYKAKGWMSRPKSVILLIESDDDICAVVSIQNFSCPVFDNERDILYDGYYLTMTRRGGITLTQDSFPIGFYIVFIVKTSDEDCSDSIVRNGSVSTVQHYFGWDRTYVEVPTNDGRVKTFSFRVIETISYQEYLIAGGLALVFFLAFYVAFFISVFCEKTPDADVTSSEEGAPTSTLLPSDVTNAVRRRNVNVMNVSGESTSRQALVGEGDVVNDNSSSSDTESDISTVADYTIAEQDWYKLSGKLCLANLARCRPRVLQARSKLYLWNLLTVAVFYTLPVIQLVVTYQRLLNQSGNQDLCYFNFLCAHPLMVLSDFNHVYSNLGYILLGFLFLCRVWRRHKAHRAKSESEKELGIPQHFGLLYAMGCALVSEGLLSAAYHVCPNSMNFQFDTSFMYVTSVLCMVKIYQSRHPDINARAHATFGVLALIIFVGLVGVLNANFYFWVAFTALHLVTCLVMTFQIYYLGRFKLDVGVIYRAGRELILRPLLAITPTHCGRCVLLVIANLSNWAIAAYGVTQHSRDFASHLLLVLMSNLFLYTLFYIVMKLLHRESIRWYSWVYIALTYTVWFSSSYFYLDQSTNWALTPAQSRQNNRVCSLLQLYDSHDIWHFMSSIAMFFSFNMYLTIDDNLFSVPRTNIMVF